MLQYGVNIQQKLDRETIDLDTDFSDGLLAAQLLSIFSSRTEVKKILQEKYLLNHFALLEIDKVSNAIQLLSQKHMTGRLHDGIFRELRRLEIKNAELDLKYLKVWRNRMKGIASEDQEYQVTWDMMENAKRQFGLHTTSLMALEAKAFGDR